jgi:hypothetical protein
MSSMVRTLQEGLYTTDVRAWAEDGGLQQLNVYLAGTLLLLTLATRQ